ncbi:MAG: hypothetical protein M3295_01200 [Chloroflexota bacterium]|nr:hypothetical protein [Chloroflexota bacterium]
MSPWLVLALLTAGINLSLFVMVRGRWDRLVPLLGLAALVGAMLGNALADVTRVEVVRIGDFNFVTASVAAQLGMLATLLLTVLGPQRRTD